ncbi:MAG: hypothetical protein H2212_07130 [Ruminococcus sp.]|nr:hypothetical protein [Ruminococcus sp.]
MKFKINCSFGGFCGDKAVICQDGQARLVNYYSELTRELKEKLHVLIVATCKLNEDGNIWITNVENQD